MEELKRCPFCGGEAWLREFTGLNKSINYYVECGYIECAVSPETAIFETPEEAVAAWNNRKPVEDVLEQLEAVKDNDVKVYGKRYAADSFAAGYAEGTKDAINIIKTELGG